MKARIRHSVPVVCSSLIACLGACTTTMTEDEQYERLAAFHASRAEIRAFINNCEAADYVVVYTGPTTHKLRDPVRRIPRHARPSDYQCASDRDVEAFQAEMALR